MRCRRAQVTTLALHLIYSGQSKICTDGSQKLLIGNERNAPFPLSGASHRRLQITALVEVAGCWESVNHICGGLWITGRRWDFLASSPCLLLVEPDAAQC